MNSDTPNATPGVEADSTLNLQYAASGPNEFAENGTSTLGSSTAIPAAPKPLDPRVLDKVWSWVTSHPDIWVGKKREGNDLSFAKACAYPQNATSDQTAKSVAVTTTPSKAPSTSPTQASISLPEGDQQLQTTVQTDNRLRIYTSIDRMWQAVTGHSVDPKRVPDSEFKCLRIIAAAGPQGIAQPELIKLSSQDKRSVPKRTDRLQSNGYIEKKAVYTRGQRTSLLTHKRFLGVTSQETKQVFNDTGELILDNFLDCLCEWLREHPVINMEELDKRFGPTRPGSWERKALFRAYERLDIVGVIQRLRMPIIVPQPPIAPKGKMSRKAPRQVNVKCVKLLKIPTIEDRQRYHNLTVQDRNAFRHRLEAQDASLRAEHAENDGDEGYARQLTSTPSQTPDPAQSSTVRPVVASNSLRWNPDMPHSNIIYDIIAESGKDGISTMDLRHASFGDPYQRPLDVMLARATDDWQSAQPAHLRHLGIVRDTGLNDKNAYYKYRTYGGFQSAVDSGDTQWETIRSRDKNVDPPPPALDSWGFPILKSSLLLRDGRATLAECVVNAKVEREMLTSFDPVIVEKGDGTIEVKLPAKKTFTRKRKASVLEAIVQDEDTPPPATRSVIDLDGLEGEELEREEKRRYNAKYRRDRKLEEEAEHRKLKIRLRAEEVAYEEAVSKTRVESHDNIISGDYSTIVQQALFKPRKGPTLTILDDVPPTPAVPKSDESPSINAPKKRGRPRKSQNASQVNTAPQNATPKGKSKRQAVLEVEKTVKILESRILELVAELSDPTRSGVHIDPPGSKSAPLPEHDIQAGRYFQRELMVVFKFPWLKSLDWFVPPPPPTAILEVEDAGNAGDNELNVDVQNTSSVFELTPLSSEPRKSVFKVRVQKPLAKRRGMGIRKLPSLSSHHVWRSSS